MQKLKSTIFGNDVQQIVLDGVTMFSHPEIVLGSWVNNFTLKKEDSNTIGLRNPQIGAFHSILSHWTSTSEIGTVVLPTGTGKTETMLSILVSERLSKVLVIVPTDPLRKQIAEKFTTLGLLKELGIINENVLNPVVGVVRKSFTSVLHLAEFLNKCNVIVATARIISKMAQDMSGELNTKITHIFIDEAHHSEATTWNQMRLNLSNARILQFTATPFRNDNKKVDGKIIYNYPLRKAQLEGYFKPITFQKIYEYSSSNKDQALAEKGIQQLRLDRQRFNHILLARVGTKKRADEIFNVYNQFQDEFRIVKIHSGMTSSEKSSTQQKIVNREVDVIVCVDMLGEGFDLPSLKIAVFHDIRQSLPITLQFVGRFTRTKYDEELGNATIIANLADLDVNEELDVLYSRDPDWNAILPILSENRTQKEVDIYNFIKGFTDRGDFPVNVKSITPALSTVIFRNNSDTWSPLNYLKGFSNPDSYELIRHNYNPDEKILVVVTVRRNEADWINNENITDLNWNYYVVYWQTRLNLLFIHSSDNSSLHIELAKSILDNCEELITGDNGGKIFRVLGRIHRFKLQNVGLTDTIGKFIRFVMRVGSDIEQGLSQAAVTKAKKAMVFGAGYENGEDISIGCSYKGRVWSRRKNDIPTLVKWFNHIGHKIVDDTIDADGVLKNALVAKPLAKRPAEIPFLIDWNEELYKQSETRYSFNINNVTFELYTVNLVLVNPSDTGDIRFAIESNGSNLIEFDLQFCSDKNGNPTFSILKVIDSLPATVTVGSKTSLLEEYFYNETPSIWFVNGDYMEGNSYYELKQIIQPFRADNIIPWDWTGVDLRFESQKYNPKIINSIQYNVIQKLRLGAYDVIFDDDGSGEVADIVTLLVENDKIKVELYHLKYAADGVISRKVTNLYEVCGQAQKSINWRFKKGKELLEHLLRREALRTTRGEDSRFELGHKEKLLEILELVHGKIPLEFEIFIIQPAISKQNVSEQQLTLLGATETYLMERAATMLKVIGSN